MGENRPTPTDGILKRSSQVIVIVLILMAILVIPAGRLAGVTAWVFIGTHAGSVPLAVPFWEEPTRD